MKILVVDDNLKDTERLSKWLAEEGAQVEVCHSGKGGDAALAERGADFAAVLVSWDMPGTHNGQELLARHRRNLPELKIVVMSHDLDITVAARAHRLGADDFLRKPLASKQIMACLNSLCAPPKMAPAFINELRGTIRGESQALMRMLDEVARAITTTDLGVLIIGETGTGKELIAQAIHKYGAPAGSLIIPVNISASAPTVVEDALFGHERFAFTDAKEPRKGFLEEAGQGTLFLDEIGELSLDVQIKLLRVLQEKLFNRLGSTHALPFKARLICATNRDLATAVNEGKIRGDFYHRIAELTIHVPPLRDRQGDLPLLLQHFLDSYRGQRNISFTNETLSILNNYHYPGNIRELIKIVRAALAKCGEHENEIRPRHLNLKDMATLHGPGWSPDAAGTAVPAAAPSEARADFDGAQVSFPVAWLKLPIKEAEEKIVKAFDFVYLKRLLEKHRYIKKRVADEAGIDRKTLDQRLEEAGLSTKESERSPLGDEEE